MQELPFFDQLSSPQIWSYAGVIIAAISSIAAIISSSAARVSAKMSIRSNEAQVFLEMSQRYSDAKIREALLSLDAFYLSHREQYEDMGRVWKALLEEDPNEADKIRFAARDIGLFFVNLGRLYEAKLISKYLAEALLRTPGTNTFYFVATPILAAWLSDSVAPHYSRILMKVVKMHGGGMDSGRPR